jgi:phosphatidylglycerol:prolipoprotein diacylglycerol transferase
VNNPWVVGLGVKSGLCRSRTVSAKREKTLRRARAAAAEKRRPLLEFTREEPDPATPASVADVTPPKSDGATATRWGSFLDSAQRQILAVTYWFDPPPAEGPSSVRIRFSGRRAGTGARTGPRDHFVCEKVVDDVGARSGRIAVTAKVHDIEPGEWVTSATSVGADDSRRAGRGRPLAAGPGTQLHLAGWSWRSWALHERSDTPLTSCLAPAVRVPALIPYIWGPMVFLGVLLGLVLQALIVSHLHISVGRTFAVSVVALIAGAIGAKLWYAVIKRRQHDVNGWCIQGFLVAFTLVAPAMATLLSVAIGTFLDVSAPGIFLGAVAGRFGCFLAGCCGGRPTTSRWGVWSSDQNVGRRRIPTQLIEAGLAAAVSLGSLLAVLMVGPRGGALFVASVAAYTFVRQGILRLRAERRVSVLLGPIVTAGAAAVLLGDALFLVIRSR